MHVDLYTKSVLTVIAIALSVIAFRGPYAPTPAMAQPPVCGAFKSSPCHITGDVTIDAGRYGVPVYIKQ